MHRKCNIYYIYRKTKTKEPHYRYCMQVYMIHAYCCNGIWFFIILLYHCIFYKLIDENIFSFFYKKVAFLFFECFIFIFLGITIISLIFSNYSHYLLLLILFSLVILQYILIVGTISLISPNVLVSIGISIIYWIGSIILVSINKNIFGVIAPFEASNSMYMSIEKILKNKMNIITLHDVWTTFSFFIIVLIINFIILILAKKRWLKLGM